MVKYRRSINRITPELYAEIKSKLHTPADDEKVMKEYGIGKTVTQYIRNTDCYLDYKCRTAKKYKDLDDLVEHAKYDRDEPEMLDDLVFEIEERPSILVRIVGVFLVLCLCALVAALTFGALRWAFNF